MKTSDEITKTLGKTFLALKIITASGISILTAFLIFFIVAVTQEYNLTNPDLLYTCLIVFMCFVVAYVIAACVMLVLTKRLVKHLDAAEKLEKVSQSDSKIDCQNDSKIAGQDEHAETAD